MFYFISQSCSTSFKLFNLFWQLIHEFTQSKPVWNFVYFRVQTKNYWVIKCRPVFVTIPTFPNRNVYNRTNFNFNDLIKLLPELSFQAKCSASSWFFVLFHRYSEFRQKQSIWIHSRKLCEGLFCFSCFHIKD